MSKKPSKSDWVDATLALALAGGGGLLVLLSVLTLRGGGMPAGDGALPVLARAMIGNFGLVPGLCAGLVMAGVGSWMFLANRYEGVVRHLAGALCTIAGLAVLLGALSEDAGGRFGAALGGTASSILTKGGGAIFGLAVLLAPVWFFWFRDRIDLSSFIKSAPRSAADSDAPDAGVSVAEAEALAPVMSAGQAAPELLNPYPEDVRLKGALPAGTLPLDVDGQVQLDDAPDDASSELADPAYDASVNRWTPQRDEPAAEPVDEDLVDAGSADDEPQREEYDGDELGEVRPLEPAGDAADPFAEHLYDAEVRPLVDPADVAVAALDQEAEGQVSVELAAAYQPPRPSWEVVDEDELVAEAVPAEVSEALEQAEDDDLEDELLEDPDEEELEESYAASDIDEEEDDEEEYEEEEEPEEELEETYAADDSDEEEEEYEEEEEPEEELEETYAEDDSDEEEEEYEEEEEPEEELEETYAEDDSDEEEEEYEEEEEPEEELEETYAADDSDEEEEEYEEEEEPEEELEETYAADDSDEDEEEYEEEEPEEELEEAHAAESSDQEGDAETAAAEEALEPAVAAAPAVDAASEVQMDLFDEPAAPVAEAAPEPVAVADAGESEPEVVLEPQAAPGDDARKISAQMLTDAGNLFVTEQRVAVSMLQKRFALDFDQSCVILDELQQLGLIGPFVEGAPRDILMSSEEWLELTGQS